MSFIQQTYAKHLGSAGLTVRAEDTDRNGTWLQLLRGSKQENAYNYVSVHSFNNYLWCAFSEQDTVAGTWNQSVNRIDKNLCPVRVCILVRGERE